jgi:hypothetical protein
MVILFILVRKQTDYRTVVVEEAYIDVESKEKV